MDDLSSYDPNDLLLQAQAEPARVKADACSAVIVELRHKGFSFREITTWLRARGVQTNHNAVYRLFQRVSASVGSPAVTRSGTPGIPRPQPDEDPDRIKLL